MGFMSNVIDDDTRTSDDGELTMYTTSWCGYYRRLKTALKASGIKWQKSTSRSIRMRPSSSAA